MNARRFFNRVFYCLIIVACTNAAGSDFCAIYYRIAPETYGLRTRRLTLSDRVPWKTCARPTVSTVRIGSVIGHVFDGQTWVRTCTPLLAFERETYEYFRVVIQYGNMFHAPSLEENLDLLNTIWILWWRLLNSHSRM